MIEKPVEPEPEEIEAFAVDPMSRADDGDAAPTLLVVRFSGDLTTKASATRRRMTSRLLENLRASIRASGRRAKVIRRRNRLFVELVPLTSSRAATGDSDEAAGAVPDDLEMTRRLARVFGVQSVAIAHAHRWSELDDVVEAGRAFGAEAVRDRRFAVRARRVGEKSAVPIRSVAIERALGEALRPLASRVDLSNPEVTISVELDGERAYYSIASEKGAGGLPLGSSGRAVSLLSGGFDSPVASWRLMRRGVSLDYVFCNLGGQPHQMETLRIAKRLADRWQSGTRPRFHAIDFDAVSREIQDRVSMRYWQIVLKRMMLRAAEAVARQIRGSAIVTGDALGQVSSQTLQNLAVISDGARLPILRPLLGHHKDEIIAESKIVGTHDLSARVGEYCAIVPSRPTTQARLEEVLAQEARMDPGVLARALAERVEMLLSEVDLEAWQDVDLMAHGLEPGEVLIDLRSKDAYTTWHHPAALCLEFPNALRAYGAFDPEQRYVLYCEHGLKSAHLADLMRRAGLSARHVSGGLREIRRWVEGEVEGEVEVEGDG